MKKKDLEKFVPGTALYVVAHTMYRKKRGKRPSLSFGEIRNPRLARRTAIRFVCEGAEFFPPRTILSVISGRKFCESLNDMYDILHFMIKERPTTVQIPRFVAECRPHLFNLVPFARQIDLARITTRDDMAMIETQYGRLHKVTPLPRGSHVFIDLQEEITSLVGEEKFIRIFSPR